MKTIHKKQSPHPPNQIILVLLKLINLKIKLNKNPIFGKNKTTWKH